MSKKWILLLLSAFVLGACSDKATLENIEATEEINKTEDLTENDKDSERDEATRHEEWVDLPEYPALINIIGNNDVSIEKLTDNQGKRILLVVDQSGTETYKSIFIKDTNRLKIIKLADNGEVFNEVIH